MTTAIIYWVRDPKNETDQFGESTIRDLQASVNKDRKIPLNIAHIFVKSIVEIDPAFKPTIVILCGAHPKTGVTGGMVYSFRCLGDMEKCVVEVLNREPGTFSSQAPIAKRVRQKAEGAD
jgi:hypothetical protein